MGEEEKEVEEGYSLIASKEGLGELVPVIKDKFGNIIDGFHRKGENQNWREEILPWIDTPEKLEAARLAVNFNRRKMAPEEIRERIVYLLKSGMKADEIVKLTGVSLRTIQRYTPQEFKNQAAVEMGKMAHMTVSGDTCHFTNVNPVKENSAAQLQQTVESSDVKLDKVACPKCLTDFDSDLEYTLHWSHKHYGSAPAPVRFTNENASTEPTESHGVTDEAPAVRDDSVSKSNETEPEEEEQMACPCCGSLLNPQDYELTRTEVAIKYGKTVQQKLFPTEEVIA
jgi:hypothetical protein